MVAELNTWMQIGLGHIFVSAHITQFALFCCFVADRSLTYYRVFASAHTNALFWFDCKLASSPAQAPGKHRVSTPISRARVFCK